MPADKSKYVFSFTDSYERLLEKKKTYLSNLAKKKNLSKRSLQMKNTYLACMNEKARAVEEKSYVLAYVNMIRKVKIIKTSWLCKTRCELRVHTVICISAI